MNNLFVVPLTNSDELCIIDAEDSEKVMNRKWFISQRRIQSTASNINSFRQLLLHNFILGESRVDHKNRNPLDNRKSNLRKSSQAQNFRNISKRKNTSSKYKGVAWDKSRRKFHAYKLCVCSF